MSRMGSSAPLANPVKISQEKIAQRAYEKWVQRGRPHGDGVQDWLAAEKELKEEMTRGTMVMPPAPPTSQRRQS